MPKVPPRPTAKAGKIAKTKTKTGQSSTNANGGSSSTPKSAQPKLYSNFLPIPISLPSPIPIPISTASSSKSATISNTTHYMYCRPHTQTTKSTSSDEALPEDRTLFVVNLPVDITERDLRTVFNKWGVVEDVRINGRGGEDVLERAVRGLSPEDNDEESDDEDDNEDEDEQAAKEVDAGAEDGRVEPTFQGDKNYTLTKSQRRNLKKKKKNALPDSVPSIISLPSLNPRSTTFGQSGLSSAHIIFLDTISITRLMSSPSSTSSAPISLPKYSAGEPTGIEYYTSLHNALRPSLEEVKAFADSSMARFDHLHSLLLSSRAKKQGAGALVDEDGFTVVVRSGRYGRAGGRGDGVGKMGVGVASRGFDKKNKDKKKGLGAGALEGFYKFQQLDQKRRDLADLRLKFEQDKAKVEELKKSRRYKPY
ncbi:hypothetical protein CI109_103675 [Kwoniella shandongensis]|uniref:Uncharacterized protein n=1 Tax=Kwoniella shandongensis TaxID=1734106 RepID=A0A5M6CD69_9TREE|nr:uncharacterized protein CI109_000631 [Kwoniella shandongensis]KAA5531059.1 hypothetical protein CI109_000631 [Kwoniella shandongensis]